MSLMAGYIPNAPGNPTTAIRFLLYGTAVNCGHSSASEHLFQPGEDAIVHQTIVECARWGVSTPGNEYKFVAASLNSSDTPFLGDFVTLTAPTLEDILISNAGSAGFIVSFAATIPLSNFRKSDDTPSSPIGLFKMFFGSKMVFIDMAEDYPFSELIAYPHGAGGGDAEAKYTYNPRFVLRTTDLYLPGGIFDPGVLEGLTYTIEVRHPLTLSVLESYQGLTDEEGRIGTTGEGHQLLSKIPIDNTFWFDGFTVITVRVQGVTSDTAGAASQDGMRIKPYLATFSMASPFHGEIALSPLRPNFEGEMTPP
jgi:hypothetical protein